MLADATDQANRKEVNRVVVLIKTKRKATGAVGVLGLSYKPGTNVIDASQGLLLAQALVTDGIPVLAYDPAAMDEARKVLGDSVCFADSAESCIQLSDLLVIATPWREFESLEPGAFAPSGSRKLIDCWRILEGSKVALATEYIPLGVGPSSIVV